ncbi:MAG TPA: hypothetical protein VM009_03655 [Terriglobales bacterium]|nr:hypothetical protein [Terriglobales bacterium]
MNEQHPRKISAWIGDDAFHSLPALSDAWNKSALLGLGSAAFAFGTEYVLAPWMGGASLAMLIAAVAFSCWRRDWRAGLWSTAAGLLGAALLLPPFFTLTIDSGADIALLVAFAFSCLSVCLVARVSDSRAIRLRAVEKRSEMSEGWIESAQQELALWTWELNLENSQLQWRNPYGEIASQEMRTYDIWLNAVHPADRERFAEGMKAARQTGVFQHKYLAYTQRGLHRLASRGVVLQQNDSSAQILVGITVDLDCEAAPKAGGRGLAEDGQLVLSLLEINDLLAELEQETGLTGAGQRTLSQARERLAKMLIKDTTPSISD